MKRVGTLTIEYELDLDVTLLAPVVARWAGALFETTVPGITKGIEDGERIRVRYRVEDVAEGASPVAAADATTGGMYAYRPGEVVGSRARTR